MDTFPSYPVPVYPVKVTSQWKTLVSDFEAGKEQRRQIWTFPKRSIGLSFGALRQDGIDTLWNFYNKMRGAYEPFYFFDPTKDADGSWHRHEDEYVGRGDGSIVSFELPCRDAHIGEKFTETFDDSVEGVEGRWGTYSGSGELSIVSGALSVGNNSGNDQRWLIGNTSIPFDPTKLYRVFCRIRRTAGAGTCYIGVAGRNATDTEWVNISGANQTGNQHYCAINSGSPGSSWTEYVGYFKGTASTGDGSAHPNPANPTRLHENVRYVRPLFIVNYSSQAGTYEIDTFRIEEEPLLIYVNGTVQEDWSFLQGMGDGGVDKVQFSSAPANGSIITASLRGQIRYRVRFEADNLDKELFQWVLWNTEMVLREVRA